MQCCGSRMFIPDPGSWFLPIPDPGSRIPDPGSKNSNKRGSWKKISCHTFLCSHKFHKIVNYFSFEVVKKKIWANFQRIIELFTKKIVKKLIKIWSWDLGSEIRDPEKTYSRSRIQGSKSTRSRIRIRNTALMRIRDPEWEKIGSGMEKIQIRDWHPGSATLLEVHFSKPIFVRF